MEWRKKREPPPPPIVDGVIIKVYEEALPRPAARRRPTESSRPSDAPPSLGYDRKQLLLAYSRQLRRLHLPESNSEPSWIKWKAAFLRSECQMNKKKKQQEGKPFRSTTQMWISGVVCRVRRRRREHNYNVAPTAAADDDEHRSCSSSRGAWGRATARISSLWNGGMCGCCRWPAR